MADDLVFDTDFPVKPRRSVRLRPLVRRVVANNPGPFTFTGTCTYIVGAGRVAVIDPGPDLPEHVEALLRRSGRDGHAYPRLAHPSGPFPRRRGR